VSRGGAVVRTFASHPCVPGSIPGRGVICGLSSLSILVLAPTVFLRVLRFSSPLKIEGHGFVIRRLLCDNLVLSIGLIMGLGHREEIR